MKIRLLIAALFVSLGMMAANTVTTQGSRITSAVTVAANTDYTLTLTSNLFSSSGSVNIPSSSMEHSTIIFKSIKPSVVKSNWLRYVKINGSTASDGTNCQVKMYGAGTIIMPYSSSFQPLTCYTGTNYTGSSYSGYTTGHSGGYMKSLNTTSLNNNIKSFKLKRGYMVTFATGTSGYGYSRCFIADKEDLEMDLPPVLAGKVSSYRLFVWYDAQKKGLASDDSAPSNNALNTSWCYSWGAGQTRLPDQECVVHQIHTGWPGIATCGSQNYSTHMKTDNEPANSADDNPATVDQVLGYWENAMRTGLRLCAPSSHDGGYTWQEQFMNEIDARGWRCDILDMHCYWVEGSFSSLQSYYNKFHRPIWVSEWIWGASWNSNGAFASGVSDNTILSTTQSIWNKMNGYAYVERYAYWNSESKAKIYNNGLTTLGTAYANMDSGLGYNKNYEFVPVVVIKIPYSLTVEQGASTNSVILSWKDSNGDMMDEIQVQYKPAGSNTWVTLTTVTRKDKTSSSDQSYSYSGTVEDWENCSFRIVDKFNGSDYASIEYRKLDATSTTDQLTFIPANTDDFYFQFYSKEASSDILWGLGSSAYPDKVVYKTPDTPGNDLTQLWILEANDYGGYTMRNLSNSEYAMYSSASSPWDFNSNNNSYKTASLNTTFLPIYYSNGDYWVVKNVSANMYVGLWDNDKNFAVGERLAGNRTNPTGQTDSGDRIGIRAIPRSLVNNGNGNGISGKYYVYNPSRNLFLTAANDWGTQASLGETGVDINIIASGAYSLLDTDITNGGESHYMGSNLYMDGGSTNWTIAESGTYNGKTTYTFTSNGTNYLSAPTSGNVLTTVNSATDNRAQWVLYTKSELLSQMLTATESSPVNATFMLPGYGFSRNDNRNLNWTDSPTVGGENTNMNGEKYNTTFDVYQEIVGLPNGVYELTMQGFYRDGGYNDAATLRRNGNEALNATLYMNDTEVSLPSIFEGAGGSGSTGVNTSYGYIPNGQGEASAYFNANNYKVGPISVTVTDGTLRIGVKKSASVTNDWTVFDNFKLMYYGQPSQTTIGTPVWNIDNDAYIQSFNNLTVSFPRAESTASGATFSLIGNNPTATLSDGTNNYSAALSLSGKTVTMNFNGFTLAPGKDYTVTLPANTVGFNGLKTNELEILTFHTPVLYDATYYMLNNEEYKYISRGQTWNTQAIVDDYGLAIHVETDNQGNTHLKCFDNQLFVFDDGTQLYADGGNPMNFTPIAVDGGYRFMNKANSLFLGVNGNALMANRTAADATTVWTLEPLSAHAANYVRNADAQASQAASAAQLTGITTAEGLAAKLADDFIARDIAVTGAKAEKIDQYAATAQDGPKLDYYTETVTGLKPGIYRLTADAFQRAAYNERVAAAGGARGLVFLFANDAKTQLKSLMEYGASSAYASDFEYNGLHYPNNEASAYTALESGNYSNEVYVYVPADNGSTTGSLTFGIEIENRMGNGVNAGTWAVYDNFKLEYLEPMTILDELSPTAPVAATNATVKLKRTIIGKTNGDTENAWNTICFPFALSAQQIQDIFGEGTVVKELSSVDNSGDYSFLTFSDVESIAANTPYIMQVEADNAQSEYIIEGLDITPSENLTVTVDGLQFIGNYIYPKVMDNSNGTDYYILNDEFKSSTGRTKIKGFRAYFHAPEGSGIKSLGFNLDGDATSIDGINANGIIIPADIYNVGGQLVRKQASSLNGLPAGIYFINGKKVLVR